MTDFHTISTNPTIYKPFEKAKCSVTGKMEQLDPTFNMSLDGMASKVRRREISPPIGWGLNSLSGFETRFHGKKVSNVTFRTLHPGYTKGSMLVNFSDDELWMKNLGELSGVVDFGGEQIEVKNIWHEFLLNTVRDIEPVYTPPSDEADEWYSFSAEALVNGKWLSVRPPTIAGCVIDVPNFSGEGPAELPCEIPVTFRDFDFLCTERILSGQSFSASQVFSFLLEKFFSSNGKPTAVSRLCNQGASLPGDVVESYLLNGHGFLGMLKGERERFGVTVSIPQLELRNVDAASG